MFGDGLAWLRAAQKWGKRKKRKKGIRTRKIAIESIQVQSGFRMVRTGSFPDSEAENPPWLPRWPTAALSASELLDQYYKFRA